MPTLSTVNHTDTLDNIISYTDVELINQMHDTLEKEFIINNYRLFEINSYLTS